MVELSQHFLRTKLCIQSCTWLEIVKLIFIAIANSGNIEMNKTKIYYQHFCFHVDCRSQSMNINNSKM